MVRIDSNKIEAPLYLLKDYKKDRFIQKTLSNPETGNIISSGIYTNGLGLGIKNVTINENKGVFSLETSAKVLGEQYKDGINLNTIERVLDAVNATGIVSINKGEFIDTGKFLRLDVTDNIKIDGAKDMDIVDALMSLRGNSKFQATPYKRTKNYGVTFKNNASSFRERLIAYSKIHDIKKDRSLLDIVPYTHLAKEFDKVWRVESNIAEFRKIREHLGVLDTGINSVLNSSAKVNYTLLKKIQKNDIQLELFYLDRDDITMGQVIDEFGRRYIVQHCCYEINIIENILLKKCKGRNGQFYREKEKFEQCISKMLTEQNMDAIDIQTPLIKMIEELLLAA
jgi:hypothetical protein